MEKSKRLSLERYRALEQAMAALPLQGPGILASRSVTLGELGLVKADHLMRYRQHPIALVKSHNPDLPKYPGKSFLTLHTDRYGGGSSRVSHDAVVDVVGLSQAVPVKERPAVHQLANEADWARTCELVLDRVLKAGAQHLVVQHWKPEAPDAPHYSEEFLPVETWSASAAYLSPVWLNGQKLSTHLDAHKSLHGEIPLPPFMAELCEPQHISPILPYIDCYLVDVAAFEARFRAELARLS